jgi:hypothetical protein
MITKEDIKPGVRLKLLCDRGKVLKGNGMRCEGTIITIKKIDIVRTEFEDTDGHVYEMIMLEDFDLAPSDLPTDRPLTYDETQMLKKGDVYKNEEGHYWTVTSVDKNKIYDTTSCFWDLDPLTKNTRGDIYFVSHGKEESKEEKKVKTPAEIAKEIENIYVGGIKSGKGVTNWRSDTVIDASKLGITSLEIKSQEPMFDSMKKHIEEHRKFLLRSTKDTKSVSQILYGR